MKKIINVLMLITCLFITSCSDDNEPDAITPIRFEKSDYTVMYGKGAAIPFTGGGGVYELTASNPEVLGKFGIDMETNNRLYIQPNRTGESYLTIKDVRADVTVTLHFTVEDFSQSFRIDEIEGTNANEFFEVGSCIKFIRNEANTKPVEILKTRNMSFDIMTIGEGIFNINRSDTNVFTMEFSLHHRSDEEYVRYEYIMGGDGEYMTMFDSIFGFGWKKTAASLSSRSQPVKRIEMILTDKGNSCKIKCHLVQ